MTKIIPRNTVVPTKKSQMFSTYMDNQTTVTIQVYQGERSMTQHNTLLGRFDLTGIAPAPRNTPQINVTFEIDTNGIVSVSAEDKGSGKSQKITITAEQGRLSKAEIERMIEESERYAQEDKEMMERVESKNTLDGYIASMKRSVEDKDKLADKIEEDDKTTILNALKDAETWLFQNPEADTDEYKSKLKSLEEICNPIIQKLYQGNAAGESNYDSYGDEL